MLTEELMTAYLTYSTPLVIVATASYWLQLFFVRCRILRIGESLHGHARITTKEAW
jgi:hypothetical protein